MSRQDLTYYALAVIVVAMSFWLGSNARGQDVITCYNPDTGAVVYLERYRCPVGWELI